MRLKLKTNFFWPFTEPSCYKALHEERKNRAWYSLPYLKMMLVSCILLLSGLPIYKIAAQEKKAERYQVIDSLTQEPIPLVTISSERPAFVTSSDSKGYFSIDFANDSLCRISLSHIGYKSRTELLLRHEKKAIILSPYTRVLEQVEISPTKPTKAQQQLAKKLMKNALAHLAAHSENFLAEADYKHRILENGRYVKLSDGRILYSENLGNKKKHKGNPEEGIIFLDRRTSLDRSTHEIVFFLTNYSFYLDEFNFLLNNELRYANSRKESAPILLHSSRSEQGVLYTVSVESGFERNDSIFGKAFVFAEAIFKIRHCTSSNEYIIESFEKKQVGTREKGNLKHYENNFFKLNLKKYQGILVPEQIHHLLYQSNIRGTDTVNLEASHQLLFDTWRGENEKQGKAIKQGNIQYNERYWNNKPLTHKELNELGGEKTLLNEFTTQHQKSETEKLQEELLVKQLSKRLAMPVTDTPYYLIFWNHPEDIREYFTKAAYIIPVNRVIPVFIYAGNSYTYEAWRSSTWTSDLMYFPNLYLPNTYLSLLPSGQIPPGYLIITSHGKTQWKAFPLEFD